MPLVHADFKTKTMPDEQCTGLKDKNGKLIYEGDIVKCAQITRKVCFGYYGTVFSTRSDYGFYLMSIHFPEDGTMCLGFYKAEHEENSSFYEIIGNIHENGDLL
jgi:uncharacterized phage protein (TIGR01671 family)